jgi:hypothetical protein
MARFFTVLAVVIALVGLTSCSAPVRHGYAYDDTSIPEKDIGVLLGSYGTPSLLITAVDDRKFRQTFSEPHPVKIYVLPGERVVQLRWTGLSSVDSKQVVTPYSEGTLTIKVMAGHTYQFRARELPAEGLFGKKRVQFSFQDMGQDYNAP